MRNTIFAAAAAFALVLSAAPSFAADATPAQPAQSQATDAEAQAQHNAGDNKCEEVLANKAGHTADEITNCQPKK